MPIPDARHSYEHPNPSSPIPISFADAASVGMAAFVAGDMVKRALGSFPQDGGGRCLVLGEAGSYYWLVHAFIHLLWTC